MQVFAFGHSMTHGFWDNEGGYISRLRKYLDQKSLQNPDEYYYETYDLGVPGDDSNQLLHRFSQELDSRLYEEDQTLIILQIGANDIQYLEEKGEVRIGKEEYRENLRCLIKEAKEYTEKVVLISEGYTTIEGPIPWGEGKHFSDERLGEYVEIQREIASQKEILFIDLRNIKKKEEWSKMLEDGIHPDKEGHKLIYRKLKEKLTDESLLGL